MEEQRMPAKKTVTEEPIVESIEVNEHEDSMENVLFEDGPTMTQVDGWKEAFGQIYMTEVTEDDVFIWRVLNRREFKEIMKLENADALYREERICEKCILWPEGYTFNKIADGKAGVPSVLSEQIMDNSGFQTKSEAIPL
jgi:hypothetical protein